MSTLTLDSFMGLLPGARRYSDYISGICPFHQDRKPSLLVYEDDFFRCLACGREGRHATLHDALVSPSYARSVKPIKAKWKAPRLPKDLGDIAEMAWNAHYRLLDKPAAQWYLEKRGVEGRIEPCALGWMDGWYTIPVLSRNKNVQGVVLRAGEHVQKVTGERFIQPVGQRPMLYVPDWHLVQGKAKVLAVVFGMFDALALADIRIPVVTSTGGKGVFEGRWLDFWRGPIYIFPDEGESPEASALARQLDWRAKIIRLPYPDDVKDPCGYLETGRRMDLERLLRRYF